MALQEIFQSLRERLQGSANVQTIYGEPIVTQGRTVIPVARIAFGFGGGFGSGRHHEEQTPSEGEGGGGGGYITAVPVGLVEVTDQKTRFIPVVEERKLLGAALAGLALGLWLGGRYLRTQARYHDG
ncbi:spore germination protein GerW family protein [Anthocerotibacter panamensis]|uniref:spore germination protein GerW family protein n=1 Tax=Anthocerotibacter panamensis TaxID=2857077 RepID=UPI001C4060D6|nr:spore germination protein GerW family protein [Anthocerotibacter panamensis]